MSGVILAAGLILALALAALAVSPPRRPRLGLKRALLAAPFGWAALFGILRGLAYLTQRDLPPPSFTTPIPFYAGAALVLAIALTAFLAGIKRRPALLLAAGAVFFALAGLNYHASITEDGVRLRRCLAFTETRYAFSQVRSVKFVVDWRLLAWELHRPRFIVAFDDGTRWTTDDGFRRTAAHLDIEAIQRITTRSHVMLQQVQSWE